MRQRHLLKELKEQMRLHNGKLSTPCEMVGESGMNSLDAFRPEYAKRFGLDGQAW